MNTFAAYEAACKRISKKAHTEADEALVAAWENGTKLIAENRRLLAQAEERKKQMDEAMERVRMLVSHIDILRSRTQPNVSLDSIIESAAVVSQAREK